nr:hypothetical protein [Tanacetum cinerariifolium]
MRWIGKGFSRVDTLLSDGMLVPQQVQDEVADAAEDADVANEISVEPTLPSPSPTPTTTPPPQQELIPLTSQVESTLPPSPHQSPIAQPSSPPPQQQPYHDTKISMALLNQLRLKKKRRLKVLGFKRLRKETDEAEPAEVEEVLEVVTTAKLMTKVVATATTTITVAPEPKASSPRRRRGVIIQDPEEATTASLSVQSEDEAYARELEAELNANINWNEVIEQVKRKEKQDNAVMRYQALKRKLVTKTQAKKNIMIEEEGSKQSKRKSESFELKAAKKQRIDEEVEELKTHLQIVPNDEDDVYTEATPLALKVPVVDYQIHTKHNKPYYKIIRADGTHQLFLSFFSLLRNFDREDLEMLWKIVQERFASLEPKNFSDDFLLNALKTMFEKPNVEDNI